MVNRLVSVGDDFTLPAAVKAADANLPDRLSEVSLSATYATKAEAGGIVKAVHVLALAGQSNMSGRGLPTSPELDPVDERIFQFGNGETTISQATVPLDMVDVPAGLSVGTIIAREYIKQQAPGTVVLLIPAAQGGIKLVGTTGTTWNPTVGGSLYAGLKSQTTAALAAAAAKWPTATVAVKGLFWHQGESDAGQTQADYETALDALIAGYRTHVGNDSLPVVLGGMVPEWIESDPTAVPIRAAHVQTPSRLTYTAYADGIPNGGGSQNLTDIIHYHRGGVIALGKKMFEGYGRALANVTTAIPLPPETVSAAIGGTTMTVKWSPAPSRATGYKVEWYDGNLWNVAPAPAAALDTTVAVTGITPGVPVQVRVSTINANGTSHASLPVYANGIAATPVPQSWSDNFNRADGALTTTATGAKTWTVSSAGAGTAASVASNAAKFTTVNGQPAYVTANGSKNGTFKATIGAWGAAHKSGIVARFKDRENFIFLLGHSSTNTLFWTIGKRVANTVTWINTTTTASVAGDIPELVLSGTSVTAKVNGTTIWTGTITDNVNEIGHGLYLSSAGEAATNTWDDAIFTDA